MNTNQPEYSTWITYTEAAERLGCSHKTIQRLVNAGKLHPHRRPGQNRRLIPLEEIERLEGPAPIIGDTEQ